MSNLSLVVDNKNTLDVHPYAKIAQVADYRFDLFKGKYCLYCIDIFGDFQVFYSSSIEECQVQSVEIQRFIRERQANKAKISLAVSNPPTWLELAKARVAKGISATKKHRKNERNQAMRLLDF